MALVCIVLDSRPKYLAGSRSLESLLGMPIGCGTILSELSDAVRETGCTDFRIHADFEPDEEYKRHILRHAPSGAKLVDSDVMASLVHEYEPSDHVLIIDPRYWPIGGLDLKTVLRETIDTRWALHGVSIATSPEGTEECVHCDDNGQVTRIFRYYEQVTCSRIDAISYSLVPLATSLDGIRFDSLSELRTALSAHHIIGRDVPVPYNTVDLSDEAGLSAFNEQVVVQATSSAPQPPFTQVRPGVLMGRNCRIHPGAKLVAPIVIQDEVTIEEQAVVIGPSVLGAGSTVRRGATVAQSVLAAGASVSADTVVRQRIGVGKCVEENSSASTGPGVEPVRKYKPVRQQTVKLGADAVVLRDVRRKRSIYSAVKLAADVSVAGLSLILLAPLFLITAIAIKLDSRGPIFFGHGREGKGGKLFRCLKFRTMVQDAHQKQRALYSANNVDGPQFKLDNDPRVTRVGGWLRATNIDELPQLINVFLGQMSIVGPRPSPFRENQICVPWRRARLSVRPGITGLWQICRDQRTEGDFHQWITYDIMYVRNLTVWLDAKILLATVLTLGGMWNVPASWLVRDAHRENLSKGRVRSAAGHKNAAAKPAAA